MDNFIREPTEFRRRVFEEVFDQRHLSATSVEKDFWVCWTLRELFSPSDFAPHLSFKGGTSLSKVWGLIERFSEDLDLTLDRAFLGFGGENSPERAPSGNQKKARIEQLRASCQAYVHEQLAPQLAARLQARLPDGTTWTLEPDPKDPDSQTLLFHYPSCWPREATRYIQPWVKMEFGARSDPWPVVNMQVNSLVAETFPNLLQEAACQVTALKPERTFWEKAMLLHEETYRPPDKRRKERLARHYYDIWCLIQRGVAANAAADMDLFSQVVTHRTALFRQNWVDYATVAKGTLKLLPSTEQRDWWRQDYESMTEMFYGDQPSFDDVLTVVGQFEREFNTG